MSAVDELFWRDEILQVMFWLRGEGLSEVVAPSEVARLLAADAAMVAARLGAMAADGYVVADGAAAPRYRLSALGAELGGRSFQDEFAGLTRQAHGECGPGCWCHDPGREGEPCPNREPRPTPEPSHA